MTHIERENLKAHLANPPIGHGHAPIEFGDVNLRETNDDHTLVAWHLNAHGVTQPKDLHEIK